MRTCLSLAPRHALELLFLGLLVDGNDTRVLIVHHTHHLGVAEEVTGIIAELLIALYK